ncbi:MAG: DUF2958 domain-containing protein [Proteobacteria bacterium]|nr:DUF2958 domain-containing protein [Pseudomonadota bacterium]
MTEPTALFTPEQREQLAANWQAMLPVDPRNEPNDLDPRPVVRLFTPDARAVWLLTELDEPNGLAFGLCDLGLGFPELGYVSLAELEALRGPSGLRVERDIAFVADRPLSAYTRQALAAGRIVV